MGLDMKKILNLFQVIFLLYLCIQTTTGFDCYKCTNTADDLCLTDPKAISSGDVTVECTGYCTILRTEFTDIPGKVIGFVRDCDPKAPLIQNEIRTDAHYTKFYRSCNTDKCNNGDGILSSGGGNGNVPSEILLVPANSGIRTSLFSSSLTLAVLALISTCFTTFALV